jgi:hypothetical protein
MHSFLSSIKGYAMQCNAMTLLKWGGYSAEISKSGMHGEGLKSSLGEWDGKGTTWP